MQTGKTLKIREILKDKAKKGYLSGGILTLGVLCAIGCFHFFGEGWADGVAHVKRVKGGCERVDDFTKMDYRGSRPRMDIEAFCGGRLVFGQLRDSEFSFGKLVFRGRLEIGGKRNIPAEVVVNRGFFGKPEASIKWDDIYMGHERMPLGILEFQKEQR